MKLNQIAHTLLIIFLLSCNPHESSDTVVGNASKIPEGQFLNPILTSAPDPWVWQQDGYYYFTHTTAVNLKLYRTRDITKLAQAESKVVWTPPYSGMNSKQIWAPEIHFLDGHGGNRRWYFYYAADDGDNHNHRMWVLENASENPLEGEWVDKGQLMLPDDKWAIDVSVFEHKGQLYCIWSGWEGDENVSQNIYIVKMQNPWTPEGERVMISTPEYDWEKQGSNDDLPTVNEGPQFLQKDKNLFIVYSASGCWTDDYTLGLLTTSADADLMNPNSWKKSETPVFEKNPQGRAFAPGHNGFFKSPDGKEDWIIYHANAESGLGCGGERSTRIQKFTWNTDGTPDFGMPVSLKDTLEKPSSK